MPRWSLDIIRHRAEHLGTVVAANAQAAIKAAITIYQIEAARRHEARREVRRALAFSRLTAHRPKDRAVPNLLRTSYVHRYSAARCRDGCCVTGAP